MHRGLVPKYVGPFEVVSKVGSVAYRLRLLERVKVHPTFHVSYLKQFHEDMADASRSMSRRVPPTIQKQFDREMEKILDHRTVGQSKKNRRTEFLVQWKGSGEEDAT